MSRTFHCAATSILLAVVLFAQDPDTTFHSAARLVLVPFNVQRGKSYAQDLQRSDVILREDGHPRSFTIFEGPSTGHPLPVELVLLFDTSKLPSKYPYAPIVPVWDARSEYEFLNNWDKSVTQTVLVHSGREVRISVYHFDGRLFERLCAATSDPHAIVSAFRELLRPIPAGGTALTLLPGDQSKYTLFPGDPVTHLSLRTSTGWWMESVVATLRDLDASPVAARRALILFSDLEGGSGTTGGMAPLQAVLDETRASATPIDPVVLSLYGAAKIGASWSNTPARSEFSIPVTAANGATGYVLSPWNSRIGELTGGGRAVFPEHLNREKLADILEVSRDRMLSRYLVGFVPEATDKPGKHKLKVQLKSKSEGDLVGGEREGVVY